MSVRTSTGAVIVAGDFNAKHRSWESRVNDRKGECLSDFVNALGLIICNSGGKPTWQREDSESCIDVTMDSANLATRFKYWQVAEEYSHSDHNYIEYYIQNNTISLEEQTRRNIKNINQEKLTRIITEILSNMIPGTTPDESAKAFRNILTEILDEAPKKKVSTKRRSVYWWTQEIKQLRETSNRLRRIYTRKRKRSAMGECTAEKEDFNRAKLELTKAIKKNRRKIQGASSVKRWNLTRGVGRIG